MPKNIILCLDGTNNKFSDNLTNVVRTYSVLDKSNQVCYYDPGLGTMADITIYGRLKKLYFRGLGLAFGDRSRSRHPKCLVSEGNMTDRISAFLPRWMSYRHPSEGTTTVAACGTPHHALA